MVMRMHYHVNTLSIQLLTRCEATHYFWLCTAAIIGP